MSDKDEKYCEDCDIKKICDKLQRCEYEWQAMASWSMNGDNPWEEIDRQCEKPNS